MSLLDTTSLASIPDLLPLLSQRDQTQLLAELDKLAEMREQQAAQKRFMPFMKAMWPGFIEGRHHNIIAEAFERVNEGKLKRLIICLPPRHCFALDTPVLTTAGWKTMSTVEAGDYVYGSDGNPVEVLAKSPVFERELYKVTTDEGEEFVTDAGHRWPTQHQERTSRDNKRTCVWKNTTTTTEDVATSHGKAVGRAQRLIPRPVVQLPKATLPVDPYLLGVWLGDGAALQATIAAVDADAAIIRAEIELRGGTTKDRATYCTFGVDALKVPLRGMELIGNKHIPEAYLLASVEQRMALLKGLMDTDGNVAAHSQCVFAQSDLGIVQSVRRLLWSLGIKNTVSSHIPMLNGVPHKRAYKVSFYHDDVSNIPRKQSRCRAPRSMGRHVYIKAKPLLRTGPVQCISVAASDEVFLAGYSLTPSLNTKSEMASFLLPAWFLGNHPTKKVIQASHTAELAVGFGRKVRNLVDTERYSKVFPDLQLQSDSKAAGRWNTSAGGDYFAIGISGAVTGKGADVLIIDDPHSEQEAALAEANPEIYDKTYEWFTSGPRQRLQPGGAIVIVMCMTGDTGVRLPDGSEKPLRDIRPGDVVATCDKGRLTTAKITNWRSCGTDFVFKIKMISGTVVRANARHPFLVLNEGKLEWTRLSSLRPNMTVVSVAPRSGMVWPASMKAAIRQSTHATCAPLTTTRSDASAETLTRRDFGGKTRARYAAWRVAKSLFTPTVSADHTITEPHGPRVSTQGRRNNSGILVSCPDTAYPSKSLTPSFGSRAVNALYAASHRALKIPERIGTASYALTTATTGNTSGASCATTVTSLSGTQKQSPRPSPSLRTSDFTLDQIVTITPDGEEEVFDVEVEGTENFIANGLVSHNTRWSKRDLVGRVLEAAAQRGGEDWEVIEFPAILPSGKPTWPEFWPLVELEALKDELPNSKWMAQYQQSPTSDTSAIIKREWWQKWPHEKPPTIEFTLQSWDTAFEKSQRADYSAVTTWGVFYHDNDDTGVKQANIILLNAYRERMEFPRLKQKALQEYNDWEPDSVIIEKKASGAPLLYELRAMGIPIQGFTPTKGNDKISRLNGVSDLFASGRVWAPNTHWAEEVIEEVASFPAGSHDDYVDSTSQALHRFRQGGYVGTNLDESEEVRYFKSNRSQGYY